MRWLVNYIPTGPSLASKNGGGMRMLIALLAVSLLLTATPCSVAEGRSAARLRPAVSEETAGQKAAPRSCCKICSKGKACGNSCISRAYTCHQPPGCACDAE